MESGLKIHGVYLETASSGDLGLCSMYSLDGFCVYYIIDVVFR